MEFLGVGPSELVFIIIVALIILGPKDMQKAGKTLGKWMRSIITSDGWKMFRQTSQELRTLPNRLMREANEDLIQIRKEINDGVSSVTPNENNVSGWLNTQITPTGSQPVPSAPTPPENKIVPPAAESSKTESNQK